jgi:integrase
MPQPTGSVFRREGKCGPVWYARYRLPSGRHVQKRIGPAWADRGRPPAGYFTKRTVEAWLRSVLDEARRGTLPGMVRPCARLSDAAAEWLRYCEQERACKKSTLTEYRHAAAIIVRGLGDPPIEDVTPELIERWKSALTASNRTVAKYLVNLHGIFRRAMKVWGLPRNPVADVEQGPFGAGGARRRSRAGCSRRS